MGEVVFVDLVLLILVICSGIATIRARSLLASTMLLGIYSLLMALVWANMFAMDVAFTEAAVGAGVSTILLLGTISVVGRDEKKSRGLHYPALIIIFVTGAALLYGTLDMPEFGDPNAPVHQRTAPEYIEQTVGHRNPLAHAHPQDHDDKHSSEDHKSDHESPHGDHHGDFGHHVPNLVTAVLADYRSYDTMFETAVIFTAGVCMILLLRDPRKKANANGEDTA